MVKKTYKVLPMPITCNWFLTCPYYKIREKGEIKNQRNGIYLYVLLHVFISFKAS
ncbi:hypothetical protein GA0061096_1691 [Fictibacillus enclensis]|nr:hypothetical protein GA0061096_1691 [Fictibacillus enclensis]